jgi:release factor glutamine methyltransferase
VSEPWTVRKLLDFTKGHFEKHQVDAPRLTAEILLSHVLKCDRVRLYVDLFRPVEAKELAQFKALILKRVEGVPTQYLTGSTSFYGRKFVVDSRVLIPRPETELLVEAALQHLPKDAPTRVLDLCTGSGCVAISIAAERPLASVWATDMSTDALDVARLNAAALGVDARVTFFEGDLFGAVSNDARFDVVVSNPPYVKRGELSTLQREVQREPRLALDGGDDGLDIVRRLITQAPARLKVGALLALEIGDDQGAAVGALLHKSFHQGVRIERDLARLDRLALAIQAA